MIKKEDLLTLTKKNIATAKAIAAIDPDMAVFVAGLSLELGLKWKICDLWRISQFPDSPDAKYSAAKTGIEDRLRKALKTHNHRTLLLLSGFDETILADSGASYAMTEIEKTWNDDMKYKMMNLSEAQALIYIGHIETMLAYIGII